MSVLIFLGLPVGLLVIGVPIFVVLLIASLSGILYLGVGSLYAVHSAVFGALDSFPLLAVPLFVFAGEVMARGGIAQRLIELVMSVVGGIRGSLPVASILSAAAFGAMSGSSVACVAAIGRLTLPAMERSGYGRSFPTSLITATGVIDVIIPPSIPMIIYGIVAQVSVAQLFIAGIVPGLLIAAALSAYVAVKASILGVPVTGRPKVRVVLAAFRRAAWAVFTPVLILGGIYGGVFTPTEAAGVACIYSVLVSVLIYRAIGWKDVWHIARSSSLLVGQIMILVAAAGAYSWLITTSGFAGEVVGLITDIQLPSWGLLLVLNGLLLVVGSVLEPPAAILILTPLLTPLITHAGINPIHFGLVVTVNLAIGMFLPPFGLNLFASHAMFKVPLQVLYRGVLPFVVIYFSLLMVFTYVPSISLTLVHWMK